MEKKFLIAVLLMSLTACANQQSNSLGLNKIMSKMATLVTELLPKVLDKSKFEEAVTSGEIEHKVNKLSQHLDEVSPYFKNRSNTYKISLKLIKGHLQETQRSLKDKKLAHSRNRLMVLGEICASCHTQDTKLRTLFTGTKRSSFGSDFAYAEYNFITRNYGPALTYYEKHLNNNQNKTTRSLGRILAIHTQINADPTQAITHFKKLKKLNSLSNLQKNHIADWIAGLAKLESEMEKLETKPPITYEKLKTYVVKYLGNVDEMPLKLSMDSKLIPARYWLRGQLFHYLNTNAVDQQVPELLYWLSASDRSLDYNLYYSLADLYLKDCMMNYSKHKVAKSCYKEYQDYMEFSYSGSAGTHIPPHLREELEKLRKRIWIGLE